MDFQGRMFSLNERKTLLIISADQEWEAESGWVGFVLLVEAFCRKFGISCQGFLQCG